MEPINLAQKLAAARVQLGSLQPDKKNKDQDYSYISADKILERAGDALAANGVAIIPSVLEVNLTLTERAGKSARIDALAKMTFQVTDGATDYVAPWTGLGCDYITPDKAVSKAITAGHKYFLAKLLCVSIGAENSEAEPETGKSTESRPAPRPSLPAVSAETQANSLQGFKQGNSPAKPPKTIHTELWNKAGALHLLNQAAMDTWAIHPHSTPEEIARKIALMQAAIQESTNGHN